MKYFLYGYFGFNNFGDDLLLSTMIKEIEKRDNNAFFYIKNFNKVFSLENKKNIVFTNIEQIIIQKESILLKLYKYLKTSFSYIKRSDILLIGPGGLFLDKGKINKSIILLYLMVMYAKFKNKKIIILGVSFDVIANPINLFIIKKIFRLAEFISLRDSIGFSYAKYMTNKKKLKLTKDLIFLISVENKKNLYKKNKIGVCFIDYYGDYENNNQKREIFCKKIYDEIIKINNKQFVYIALQKEKGLDDDYIYNYLKNRGLTLDYLMLTENNINMLSDFEGFITMRYHLAILGLLFRKKVFIIDHELKMSSLKIDFDIGYVFIDDLFEKNNIFNEFFSKKERNIEYNLMEYKQKALENFKWIESK